MKAPPSHAPTQQPSLCHTVRFRVRYGETDQMGTIYNSRPLDWFEMGRTELLRNLGLPYTEIEARGLFFPVVEAHLQFDGRSRYDDLLELTSEADMMGRARLRCRATIVHAESRQPVVHGYTVHAFMDNRGRPIRPPAWFLELFSTKRLQPAPTHGGLPPNRL